MDSKRMFLAVALVLVCLQLWVAWQHDYSSTMPIPQSAITAPNNSNNANVPAVDQEQANATTSANASVPNVANTVLPDISAANSLIHVTTDVLAIAIDPRGGNIVATHLLKYPAELNKKDDPLQLLNSDPDNLYIAESGLTGKDGPDTANGQVLYTSDQTSYQLTADQGPLRVVLQWHNAAGLTINKIFTFTPNSYVINVDYQIQNKMTSPWKGYLYTQLTRKSVPPVQKGLFHTVTYLGGAISSPDQRYEKISFADMDKANLDRKIENGWAAMVQHYFVSAWIPSAGVYHYYSKNNAGIYTLGMLSPQATVAPNQQFTLSTKLYSGPEIMSSLEKVAPGLDQTVDYGKLWFISLAVFWVMNKIYSVVGNWGWSIVLVTLCIKLIFFHLSATSYRSMAKMRRLQPRVEQLKARHGEDKQRFSQELWKIYKTEKVNPLNGCLPIVVQIPVFLGLYWVLIESVELRQAPFILWIHDLSAKDPYYILPLLMGLSMFLQQRMSPAPPDPTQAKVMMLMPIFFTILFMTFPAGLVLYWFVNNTLSILQQWYVSRTV